jgi:isoquinoline 1-oxidoreductase alpha subunit
MLTLTVNGEQKQVDVESDMPLLRVIREHLQMTGTRFVCGAGLCGACTVHLDGAAVRSCLIMAKDAVGKELTTIEGLTVGGKPHPLQEAWMVEQVPPCGDCWSGQIMQAAALLKTKPHPTDAEINAAMNGNLCRCMAYVRIKQAIKLAAGPSPKAAKAAAKTGAKA